jgi:hypothetical protein
MQVRNSLRRLLRLELLNIFLKALHRSELLEHPTADDDSRLETTLAGISDRSCRPWSLHDCGIRLRHDSRASGLAGAPTDLNPLARRFLMGLAMGATAIAII